MSTPTPPSPVAAHVLVTGARGGIGAACARLFRHQSHEATPVAVTTWDLPEIDVTDHQRVAAALDAAEEEHGPVTGLIHCAGVMRPDRALETGPFADENFAVNFFGARTVATAVAARMRAHDVPGAIVVVASNAARTPRIGMASYGASKAAIVAFMKTLALECAPFGIRCNTVSPGSTLTGMLRGMWEPGAEENTQLRRVIAGQQADFRLGIPLGKVADPADIAHACHFLLSPQAGHITMQDLCIDGGASL